MLTVMSSRARRPRRPLAAVPPPTTPPPGEADTAAAGIQALVERIHAGELDAELPVLAAAITERQQLLAAAHSLITRASLRVGDRVRINHRARAAVPARSHRHGGRLLRPERRRAPGPARRAVCHRRTPLPTTGLGSAKT
jgi:hypothetical protein